MTNKNFTIGKARQKLYKTAKVLGDVNALNNHKIKQRVSNRLIGKISARLTSKITKKISKLF